MADRLDLQLISAALRRMGWIRFWSQLVLAVVVVGVLLFNNIGGRLAANSSRALGLGPGISLTTLAFLLLLWCLWQSWLIVRCGRALNSPVRPSKGETARLIKRGLLADLVGITLAVVGYQAMAGSLFVQASQQVPGFYFWTGALPKGKKASEVLHHSPDFLIDEAAFLSGVKALCHLTVNYMEAHAAK